MIPVIVAAVQAAPVFLDREATVEKACGLVDKVRAEGAGLVVFPEAFVPTYPDWVWRCKPWDDGEAKWTERLLDQSVEVPSPATEALGEAARGAGVYVSIGVNERDGATLYNTTLYFGPDGTLLGKHRKLMPTGGERLVWGMGDGSTLPVLDTPFGRLGGLTCWENYMPLARAAMYAQGIDIYLAPTWDNSDVWIPTLHHRQGGQGVRRRGELLHPRVRRAGGHPGPRRHLRRRRRLDVARQHRHHRSRGRDPGRPADGGGGILFVEIDANRARASRRQFDPVGHYSRSDVFTLSVDTRPKPAATFEG